jgi:hypothetical protein
MGSIDEFKQKPSHIRVVRDCSHVKDLEAPGKSHLAMVSDGTYPVYRVSSVKPVKLLMFKICHLP